MVNPKIQQTIKQLDAAIEEAKQRRTEDHITNTVVGVSLDIIEAMRSLLGDIVENSRFPKEEVIQAISNIKIEPPVVPPITLPDIQIPPPTIDLPNTNELLREILAEAKKKEDEEISFEIDPERIRGKEGKPGKPGKDAKAPTKKELREIILPLIPDPIKGDKGDDGSPDNGENIIDKINVAPKRFKIHHEHLELPTIYYNGAKLGGGGGSGDLTQATADARYLKLDTSNDPLTGQLDWSSALYNSTFINLPDAAGVPNAYTMHVGGGDFGGGVGDYNVLNIEMTAHGYSQTANQINFTNFESFNLISGVTGTSFNIQELNSNTWAFASDQLLTFQGKKSITLYGSQNDNILTNLTRSGTTATATFSGHGYQVGDWVTITGADDANFNGTFLVATRTASTFTYTMAGTPAASPDPNVGAISVIGGVSQINIHTTNALNAVSFDFDILGNNGTKLIHTRGVNYANPASPVATGVGNLYFGATHATTPTAFFNVLVPTITYVPANTNFFISEWDNSGTTKVTIPTGTAPLIGNMKLMAPAFVMTGSSTTSPTLYIEGAPTKSSGAGTLGSPYALFVDAGLNRFDGDGTHIFELPADATDPTGGGGAATGRIPVTIGGVTRYIPYY